MVETQYLFLLCEVEKMRYKEAGILRGGAVGNTEREERTKPELYGRNHPDPLGS